MKKLGGPGQVEPRLDAVGGGAVDRDPMMGSQRRDPVPGPAIAVAGDQPVAVQQPRDQIVAGDADQQADGIDDVGRGTVALATAPLRQAPFGIDAARPMDEQHGLAGILVDIGDHLADHGSDDALLEPGIRRRRGPDGFQIVGQGGEGGGRWLLARRHCRIVFGDLRLDLGDPGERCVPARLQLRRHQAVGGIGGVVLAEGAVRRIARRLQIAEQHLAGPVASLGLPRLGLHGRRDRARLHHLEQHLLDRVVDPQSAERDAAGLAVVEPPAGAAVARDVVLLSSIANRQLAAAAAASHEADEQGIAVLRRAVVAARGDVVANHSAYRLRPFPVDIALMRAGLQREPLGARLAPYPRPRPCLTRHISTSCCQSRLFLAKRETSRAATAPTLPRQTSATMRSNPAPATAPAAERPRSSDDLDP